LGFRRPDQGPLNQQNCLPGLRGSQSSPVQLALLKQCIWQSVSVAAKCGSPSPTLVFTCAVQRALQPKMLQLFNLSNVRVRAFPTHNPHYHYHRERNTIWSIFRISHFLFLIDKKDRETIAPPFYPCVAMHWHPSYDVSSGK